MKATKTWVLIVLLIISAINVHARPIPDTGQTKCYNNTAEIPCPSPGQAFYGQDGNYTIDPPSYTKLDANGAVLPDSAATWAMVRNNVTGLIWENKTDDGSIHDKDYACGWGGTGAFIKALNDAMFGGFSDWRLPTITEPQSIVDFSRKMPAIDTNFFPGTVFSATTSSGYWSSTPYASSPNSAWFIPFGYGHVDSANTGAAFAARAVRGGKKAGGFMDNDDGTVTDTATGLMWQQGAPSSMTWEAALTYADGLALAGFNDWRLPTITELQSIVDFSRASPAIDTNWFPGTGVSYYWSSTTYAGALWFKLIRRIEAKARRLDCRVRKALVGV